MSAPHGPPNPGQLFVQLQGETVKLLALDMPQLSIGRTPDNGLALPHPSVAIRHAEVRRAGDQVVITDLGAGDTFLAGKRLTPHQPQVLEEGAVVQIGPYVVTYALARVSAPQERADVLPPEVLQDLRFVPLRPAREKHPLFPPPPGASAYLNYLPALFGESDFVGRFLNVFERVWEPLQHRQDFIDMFFDPATCPEELLDGFARWLGLPLDPHWPEARRRAWLREAVALYRWRGTRYGLMRMLEVCCGVTPRVLEDPHKPHHLLFVLPTPDAAHEDVTRDSVTRDSVTRENLEAVIAQHVPAHVVYEVRYV